MFALLCMLPQVIVIPKQTAYELDLTGDQSKRACTHIQAVMHADTGMLMSL